MHTNRLPTCCPCVKSVFLVVSTNDSGAVHDHVLSRFLAFTPLSQEFSLTIEYAKVTCLYLMVSACPTAFSIT